MTDPYKPLDNSNQGVSPDESPISNPTEETKSEASKYSLIDKIKKNSKVVVSVLGVVALLAAVGAGVILVQRDQDIREKAATSCNADTLGKCSLGAGCNIGEKCKVRTTAIKWYYCEADESCNIEKLCPNTDCNIPSSTSGAVYCSLASDPYGPKTYCCPESKPTYSGGSCISSSPKSCDEDHHGKCVNANYVCSNSTSYGQVNCPSGQKCVPKITTCNPPDEPPPDPGDPPPDPGDPPPGGSACCTNFGACEASAGCGTGQACKLNENKDGSLKDSTCGKYVCWADSGCDGTGGPPPTAPPAEQRPNICGDITTSASTIAPGESVTLRSSTNGTHANSFWYIMFNRDNLYPPPPENNPKGICVPSGSNPGHATWAGGCPTGSVTLGFKASDTTGRSIGTITLPYEKLFVNDTNNGNQKATRVQILAYFAIGDGQFSLPQPACVTYVTAGITSSVTPTPKPTPTPTKPPSSPPTPTPAGTASLTFKFRQQGVTAAVDDSIRVVLRQDGSVAHNFEWTPSTSNDKGVWTVNLTTDKDGKRVTPGTYTVLIKGRSHLQKKFTNVTLAAGSNTKDWSTDKRDELRSGDVNDDNKITVEDIAKVLSFYIKGGFKIPVTQESKYSDINKDGFITIQDVSLIAVNWSDFTIEGDK